MRTLAISGPTRFAPVRSQRGLQDDVAGVPAFAWTGALLVTATALLVLLLVKHLPVGRFDPDFIAMLDGGYRIAQGQWPHIDFAAPHGPWPILEGWVALKLAPWFASFATYQFTQWLTVLPFAGYFAAAQPTRLRAFGILAIPAVATLVPYVMEGENVAGFSYGGGYNRLTTALLFLSFVWAVMPRRLSWLDAVATASLLLVLLATKVNGFLVAFGVLAVAAFFSSVKRTMLIRASVALAAVLAALQIGTGLPSAYFADVHTMLGINQGKMAYAVAAVALKSAAGLMAVVALIASLAGRRRDTWRRGTWRRAAGALFARPLVYGRSCRAPIIIAAIALASLAAESQNTGGLLLLAMTAAVFAPLPRTGRSRDVSDCCRIALVVALLTPWLGSILHRGSMVLTRDFPHLVDAPAVAQLIPGAAVTAPEAAVATDIARLWTVPRPTLALLDAAALSENDASFVALARTVDEAASEARRQGLIGPQTRVMSIYDVDLFARRLGAKSPVGTNLWYDPGRTFAPRSVDVVRSQIRNADAIFMRRCDVDSVDMRLNAMFRPALGTGFVEHGLTPCWSVWMRSAVVSAAR